MDIRPHHAMCILNYVGKGYDDAFSRNMTEIINNLDVNTELTLLSPAAMFTAESNAAPNAESNAAPNAVHATAPHSPCSDVLCAACPNRREPTPDEPVGCVSAEKVARYDERLLRTLGLRAGQSITYGELSRLVLEKIFQNESSFAAICNDCEWHELCVKVRFS